MTISALRAVPRGSWWTLAVAILIVSAFVFERNLGATVLVAALAFRFLASVVQTRRTKPASLARRGAAAPRGAVSSGAASHQSTSRNERGHPLFDAEDCEWQQPDAQNINPTTGSFVNEHSGVDSSGHFYGESPTGIQGHRW